MFKRQLLLAALLSLCGCAARRDVVHTETWQPLEIAGAGGYPRLVEVALLAGEADLSYLRGAGAELIGWHATRKGWAIRAGSTGGTHFFPVSEQAETLTTTCFEANSFTSCHSREKPGRWTRVAVLRVPAEAWPSLPPHLIPLEQQTLVAAPTVRRGCRVHQSNGNVTCSAGWSVVAHPSPAL